MTTLPPGDSAQQATEPGQGWGWEPGSETPTPLSLPGN